MGSMGRPKDVTLWGRQGVILQQSKDVGKGRPQDVGRGHPLALDVT